MKKIAVIACACLLSLGLAGCSETVGVTDGVADGGDSTEVSTATVDDALDFATDDGVTEKSASDLMNMIENDLKRGMTLGEVQSAMGCKGTPLAASDGFAEGSYAFYSSDGSAAVLCTFNGGKGLDSYEITVM